MVELKRITLLRAPNEAVGLILSDETVVEIPNHHIDPTSNFEAHREDILHAVENEVDLLEVTFWHSHPAGGVGPSRTDMRQKTPMTNHLVVSLKDGEIVPTWY